MLSISNTTQRNLKLFDRAKNIAQGIHIISSWNWILDKSDLVKRVIIPLNHFKNQVKYFIYFMNEL